VNGQDSQAEIFDVFLCHNSEDKPAVREIAQQLVKEGIKPFLDEAGIKPADSWSTALGEQIKTVKSAAVFFGSHGVSRWQDREITALLNESDRRRLPVIPLILASDTKPAVVPWSLEGLHWVDFRATDSQPLKRLIWAITDQKPMELTDVPTSEKPTTIREVVNSRLVAGTGQQAVSSDTIPKTRLYPPLAEPPDQEQRSQLEILRGRVEENWVYGVLSDSLKNQPPISLRKRKIDRAIDAPWKYQAQLSDSISPASLDDRDLNAIYDATGLLLILGEPGSGKTTTLLDLARILLDRARDDIKERVPVVLNLSIWKKKQPLVEWMSDELSEKYRVPRKIALFWLQQNYLLPLLDGLDEVETTLQPDCVAAINAFIEEFNPSGLVVCCRLNEYRWLPTRLKLNGAICLEPLSSEEVSKYLAESGPQLAALREAVDTDPVLQELAQTPLMLSIMSLAFQGAGGNELATQKGEPEERRNQIFRLYVEQMFQRNERMAKRKETTPLAFPKEKIIGWLSRLAQEMREHSQSVFLVEGLQPSWLGTKGKRAAYGTITALSLGLIFALTGWLIGWCWPEEGFELIFGLSFGLSTLLGVVLGCWSESRLKNGVMSGSIAGLFDLLLLLLFWPLSKPDKLGIVSRLAAFAGLSVGAIGGLGVGSLNYIALVETISWNWNQFWRRMIPGSIVGLIGGFVFGLLFRLKDALTEGLSLGLICGLVTGLTGGFISSVKSDKASPNQGIDLSRNNFSTVLFVTWLVFGLTGGFTPALRALILPQGLKAGLSLGLSLGLSFGLIAGLTRGGSAVIKHYALRLILWINGCTPFNFIKFLDHCAKLIFLKKVGGGYIFIHRMLLDYFADLSTIEKSAESKRT
jgi:DNA polymerase III delta prime subunit